MISFPPVKLMAASSKLIHPGHIIIWWCGTRVIERVHQTSPCVTEWEDQRLHAEGPTGSPLPASPGGEGGQEKKEKKVCRHRVDIQNAHFSPGQSAAPNEYLNQ